MRRVSGVLLLSMLIAACGGGAGPTATPGGPTGPPGQPTPAPSAPPLATAPPAGGTTASVAITGGTAPGTFNATADPGCAVGFMGPGIWSVNYTILSGATAGQLSELVLIFDPSNGGMTMSVGIGPIFDTANGFVEYEVTSNYTGRNDVGTGSVALTDAGATATLHATATTADGVGVDATINCPSVTRG